MYGEARKLHLIEEILKTEDESVLREVETILTKGRIIDIPKRKSFIEFVGVLTDEEADEMKKVIEDGCEQINPDDWK